MAAGSLHFTRRLSMTLGFERQKKNRLCRDRGASRQWSANKAAQFSTQAWGCWGPPGPHLAELGGHMVLGMELRVLHPNSENQLSKTKGV